MTPDENLLTREGRQRLGADIGKYFQEQRAAADGAPVARPEPPVLTGVTAKEAADRAAKFEEDGRAYAAHLLAKRGPLSLDEQQYLVAGIRAWSAEGRVE